MAYPAYVREKALSLRLEQRLSLPEIAERLALPKTTVYYWIRDVPLQRPRRASDGQRKGTLAMQRRYRRLREAAYEQGRAEFDELAREPTFRDFVCLYIAEGSKRNRNAVALGNSDDRVITLAAGWIRRFARNPVRYSIQYHADQEVAAIRRFWGERLGVEPETIALQRKSNSGRLGGRSWRSQHGVLTVCVSETLLRARLQGWIDRLRESWLDSP